MSKDRPRQTQGVDLSDPSSRFGRDYEVGVGVGVGVVVGLTFRGGRGGRSE